jgi:type II secretory pathway component PulC
MKPDYIKQKQELISIALLGISALIIIITIHQVIDFFAVSARAETVVKTAIENINNEARDIEQYFTKDRTLAESLTKNNLFVPQSKRENPVKEVRAIFGDQVLINNGNKWYKVGQMIQDAKIVAIEPTHVLIEWDGKQNTFRPIDASVPDSKQSGRETTSAGSARENPEMVVVGSQPTSVRGIAGTREQMFRNMRQNWMGMSDAEKERLRNEMRQRFGGGPGGRGFFGGPPPGDEGGVVPPPAER